MLKFLKAIMNLGAYISLALICANGYMWYTTGQWGLVSLFDVLSYVSGTEVHMPETDPKFLYNLVN